MSPKERWLAYIPQVGIAFDQLLNALIPPFFTLSWSDETLSARTYRAAMRGKVVGRFLLPIIDFLFSWQKPDPTLVDHTGEPIVGHCARAYEKERMRRGLPPEYR
jgi:hypothetical protein